MAGLRPDPSVVRRCKCGGVGPIVDGCDGWHDVPTSDPRALAVESGATPRQADVFAFVVAFRTDRGFSPTLREIAAALYTNGVGSYYAVWQHLHRLKTKGLVAIDAKKGRTITPLI